MEGREDGRERGRERGRKGGREGGWVGGRKRKSVEKKRWDTAIYESRSNGLNR